MRLVFSIYDSRKWPYKMIEESQRKLRMNSQGEELEGEINPALRIDFELEIKTLQNAAGDAEINRKSNLIQVLIVVERELGRMNRIESKIKEKK
jgi:hypothetical protein